MDFNLSAKFDGDEAEYHRIPAYEGSQSIQGISRGLVLVSHYLATGVVRHKAPFGGGIQVFIRPAQPGSLEQIYQIVADPTVQIIGGKILENVTSSVLSDFVKLIFSNAVGKSSKTETKEIAELEDARPGDVDALTDAVTPTLSLGHTAIDRGVKNIIIVNGDNNVVNFNGATKQFINQSVMGDDVEEQDLSVGSFNANTHYGRVYFHDLGKTVPFTLSKSIESETIGAITHSLDCYANGLPSDILVRFLRITASDGRTKKILIVGAKKTEAEV